MDSQPAKVALISSGAPPSPTLQRCLCNTGTVNVIFDTSVWMAAIRSRNGASFALLSQIGGGRFRYGVSTALFAEYRAKMFESVGAKGVALNTA